MQSLCEYSHNKNVSILLKHIKIAKYLKINLHKEN
jgi:hypothetical protein